MKLSHLIFLTSIYASQVFAGVTEEVRQNVRDAIEANTPAALEYINEIYAELDDFINRHKDRFEDFLKGTRNIEIWLNDRHHWSAMDMPRAQEGNGGE
ncbi:MAG: hypothetical protein MI739_09665, partial [Bacteroidales bacterium]|nr:hypothetical protein [Bacteroidales bacterium]